MKIFVTGGTGFVGRPITARLKRQKHQLLILSRTVSGSDYLKGDLANIDQWRKELEKFRPDLIVHLAWEGITNYHSAENSLRNLTYSVNFLKTAAEIGCRSFLGVGSCQEYSRKEGKLNEALEPVPIDPFAFAKNALRFWGEKIAKEKEMQFIWIRLFYAYGPGQKANSLIPYLIRCIKEKQEPVIKNPLGGNDFIYINDAADLIALIIKKSKGRDGVYNVGSGKLTAVCEIMNQVYGKKDKYPKPKGYWADISKVQKEFGWRPKIDIETGVKKTLEFYGIK